MGKPAFFAAAVFLLMTAMVGVVVGQATGAIKGTVTLEDSHLPVHNVVIVITQLRITVATDEDGNYEIRDLPAGTYTLIARLDRLRDAVRRVEVAAGQTTVENIQLKLSGLRDEVTVSATGTEQSAAEAFQGTNTLDATVLIEKNAVSLGEALEHQTGIAKRSLGPGSSRPVIRGFDGDRVLIAQDGIRTGSLSYASGDHGEPVNILSLERIEIVRGPATLLYGTSAIGGMVNMVTGHDYPHKGMRGFVTGTGGTTNGQAGGSAGLEYGTERWIFWADGGGQRTSEYRSPIGAVENSQTRNYSFSGGSGYFIDRAYFNASYGYDNNRFGIPVSGADDERAELEMRRHNLLVKGGLRNLDSFVENLNLSFNFTDYKHQELVENVPETTFFNKTYSYRLVADQRRFSRLTGNFGISGFYRDFETVGDEALAPPTTQNSFAAFAVETIDLQTVAFQFGGRIEHNGYATAVAEDRRDRSFTGFSGSAGVRVPLWEGSAVAANYTHSYRAPSLDELYNFGPHPGNLTFEIGDSNLVRELGDGIDISFRQNLSRFRGEVHFFYYNLKDFIFLAPTGEIEDALPVAEYRQADSNFRGVEANIDIKLHPTLWMRGGLDYVRAELNDTKTPLIRIPPLRGRLGFEYQQGGFRFYPELIMARDQDRTFINESRTPGYAYLNLLGSYTITQQHAIHIFAINAFNLNDKLYRNHLSFIKDFAPEIGRGIRFTYTVRFF